MNNINLDFEVSDDFGGKLTNIKMTKYDYDKYGLQMYDDLSYNLNFQTFDLENLENRSSTYSKTLKLPGTSVNNEIFSNLYDIDIDIITNYSVTTFTDDIFFGKKLNCELLYDSIPIKEGFFELKKVTYNEGLRQIEYEGEFYSKSKSFSENLGDKLLTGNEDIGNDLDFSLYDHIFSMEKFISSHSGDYYDNSIGYYYPIIDYVNIEDGNSTEIESFRPSLYIKEIIDKIFNQAGYTYSSTFFDSDMFKSLILPWTGQVKLDDENLESRNFRVGMEPIGIHTDYTGEGDVLWGGTSWGYEYRDFYNDSPSTSGGTTKTNLIPLDKDTPSPDWYNSADDDFSLISNEWTVPAKGSYRLNWTTTQNVYGIGWNGGGVAGYHINSGDKNIEVDFQFWKTSNGVTELLREVRNIKYLPLIAGDTWIPTWTENLTWSGELFEGDIVGCYITLSNYNVWYDTGSKPVVTRVWVNALAEGTAFTATAEPGFQLYEGELVEMRMALPADKSQIGFFKDIVNMFNLVVDEYPDSDNKLIIETRNTYYNNGDTLDWTDKEDISQAEEIERIPTLINKDFKLSYMDDVDDYNKLYGEDNRGLIYGNHKVANPYLSDDTYNVEVDFSPTPLGKLGNTNWGVSKIFSTDSRGEIVEQEFNTRILYRQNINADDTGTNDNLSVFIVTHGEGQWSGFGYTAENYHYQPYAGHLDSPYIPTFDLDFGICDNYYYTGIPNPITDNNIYKLYWEDYVAELMDLNSKRVTKYINLGIDDIYGLSFSSNIWIDGVLYLLEKIIDWNPGQITKVELLKLSKYDLDRTSTANYKTNITYKTKSVKSKKINSRLLDLAPPDPILDMVQYEGVTGLTSGGTMTDWTGTTKSNFVSRKNTYADSSYGIIIGENNKSVSSSIFIKGDNNEVDSGSTNVTIFGDNVKVANGVSDVIVLGTDSTGTTITESRQVYMPSGYTISNVYTKEETLMVVDDAVSGISGVTEAYLEANYYNTGQTYSITEADAEFSGGKTGDYTRYLKTTASYLSGVEYIIGDKYSGGSPRTVTLSNTQTTTGKMYIIQDELGDANTNNIVIGTEGTQTINGNATWTIATSYGTVFIYSDGINWFNATSK